MAAKRKVNRSKAKPRRRVASAKKTNKKSQSVFMMAIEALAVFGVIAGVIAKLMGGKKK